MNPLRKIFGAKPRPDQPAKTSASGSPAGASWLTPAAQVRWLGPGVAFYTPQRCEQLYRQALSGDLQSQWEIFDMMEATWPRLVKNLGQLKEDTLAVPLVMKPFAAKDQKPSDEARRRAALIEECLETMRSAPQSDENDYADTKRDLLDARAKGLSVLEVSWEMRKLGGGGWAQAPRCTRWVHPAWYGYSRAAADANLMLKTGAVQEYMSQVTSLGPYNFREFPEHRFLIGLAKSKTSHPLGSAMLWALSFWWAGSNFTAEWFLNYCQIFGIPFRWATYASTMTPADQATLNSVLANMGSAGYGAFPEGTTFDLKDTAAKGGDLASKVFIDQADKNCDLLILRQTLTSDVSQNAGSRAQGEVHERVLGSVELACAQWLCKTLQPLVRSICVLNFGDDSQCPALTVPEDSDETPDQLAGILAELDQAGFEPTDEALPDLAERLGLPIQRKAIAAAPTEADQTDPVLKRQMAYYDYKKKSDAALSARAAGAEAAPDSIDALAAEHAPAVAAALRSSFAPALEIIRASKSPADAQAKLKAHFADWRPSRLVAALEPALQTAAAVAQTAADKK